MVSPARRFHSLLCAAALAVAAPGCLSPEERGALVPPTADEDPALPQVSLHVAGHTRAVHLETFGQPGRPTVLFLHGSLGDFRAFLPLTVLAERYFLVLWDQRGNGLSERIGADEYTWDSIVEEIDAIKALYSPTRPVILVGHSFGGMYATLYLARRPENVERAVLLEPGGLTGTIFEASMDDAVRVDLFDPGLAGSFWQGGLLGPGDHAQLDYKALQILENGHLMRYSCDPDHPPHLPVWRPGAHVEYLRGVRMGMRGGMPGHLDFDFTVGLERFGGPVLILGADCSALGYDFQVRHHQPLFRDATVVRVPDAGHRLHVEQPARVLEALRAFLPAD
jgi:proline iminopeptidase